MKFGQQSTKGYAHGSRWIDGGARDQEPDGDTRRRDSDLDRFGPSDRRNTLRPVSWCIILNMRCMDRVRQGTPASSYILWSGMVIKKVSYLVLYNILRCTSTSAMHTLILWAGPPLIVRPMSCLMNTGGHIPTYSYEKVETQNHFWNIQTEMTDFIYLYALQDKISEFVF